LTLEDELRPPRPEGSPDSLSSSFLSPFKLFLIVCFIYSKGDAAVLYPALRVGTTEDKGFEEDVSTLFM
jgi:hypothetical protein